jgi:putative phosphoribosyl transferase
MSTQRPTMQEPYSVKISTESVTLDGDLTIPDDARGIVIFAHGSGSSRFSKRNQYVASVLNDGRFATLLLDLLTAEEEQIDMYTREYRFNIPLLARRLEAAVSWTTGNDHTKQLPVGLFGASTGAAAALIAAASLPDLVQAVVSRGGRPDLAGGALERVTAPTLLIVGSRDPLVIDLNSEAMTHMPGHVALEIVPGATHLFEEPGTLEEVARLANEWFSTRLQKTND